MIIDDRLGAQRGSRLRQLGRSLIIGFGAAVVAGVLAATVARILMRLVTLAAGNSPQFSWGGSIGVAVIFTLAVLPGAVLAAAGTGRFRWLLLAVGATLLLVPATGVASTELGHTGDYSTTRWVAIVVPSVGVYACIAALPVIVLRVIKLAGTAGSRSSGRR